MDDSNDGTTTNADGTSTYDNGTTETTYGAGYGDSSVLDTYQTDTQTQNELYQESTDAMIAGDSYGSYELNAQSIEAGSEANNAYQDYNGTGDYSPTESYSPDASSTDVSSFDSSSSGSSSDIASGYADYAGS